MIHISDHFLLSELTATGHALANEPGTTELISLCRLAYRVLEPIREAWGCPVSVSNAYRSFLVERAVQEAVGMIHPGAPLRPSQHLRGEAADFLPAPEAGLSIDRAYDVIYRSAIPYDQLLLEGSGDRRWIHVSVAPVDRRARRMALVSPTGLGAWAPYNPQPPGAPA